jgi:DEAD/DEAH box helicase domain-containing protein
VSEFLAPNMTWQHDWVGGTDAAGQLPATSRLPGKVKKRLLWQLFSDLTYQSQRGSHAGAHRQGDAVGAAGPRAEVAETLLPKLREQFGAAGPGPAGADPVAVGHARAHAPPRRRDAPRTGGLRRGRQGVAAGQRRRAQRMDAKMGEYTPRPVLLTLGKASRLRQAGRATHGGQPGTTAGPVRRWGADAAGQGPWLRTCTTPPFEALEAWRACWCAPCTTWATRWR